MIYQPSDYNQNKFLIANGFSTATLLGLIDYVSEAHGGEQVYAVGSEWALSSILPYSMLWNWEYESLRGSNFLNCYVTGNKEALNHFKKIDPDYTNYSLYIFTIPNVISKPPYGCLRI